MAADFVGKRVFGKGASAGRLVGKEDQIGSSLLTNVSLPDEAHLTKPSMPTDRPSFLPHQKRA